MKKFLLIIIGLFLFFVNANSIANAENIKFVQVTDVHLSTASKYSINVLKAVVKDINEQKDISFVAFTGDNIDTPNVENLNTFKSVIKELNVPYYIVIGNHDVYKSQNLSKKQFYEIIRKNNFLYPQRSANYEFKKNGFVFLIVDGAKEVIPGPSGYFRESTINWVDKELTKNKDRKVVIFQHYPLVYPSGSKTRLKTHQTYKKELYENMLKKHDNVLAIISGHFHANAENMVDGIYHISTPAMMNMPHSYKIIDIITEKGFAPLIYTQLREVEVE